MIFELIGILVAGILGALLIGVFVGVPIGLFCGFMGIEPDGVKDGSRADRLSGSDTDR